MTSTQTGKGFRIRGVSVGHLDPTGQIKASRDYYFNMSDLLTRLGIQATPD
jgi:hypothetical protein